MLNDPDQFLINLDRVQINHLMFNKIIIQVILIQLPILHTKETLEDKVAPIMITTKALHDSSVVYMVAEKRIM